MGLTDSYAYFLPIHYLYQIVSINLCHNSRENTAAIKEYIANQLKQDKESDQLSLFDMRDPFKGGK